MRVKTVVTTLLMAGLGLGLSACYVVPAPGYAYDPGYSPAPAYSAPPAYSAYSAYSAPPAYYPAPAYYGPAYYGPSVGIYYGGRWGGGWARDRRWH